MDIKFLIGKWKDFLNDEDRYSACKLYEKARQKNICRTDELIKKFIISKTDVLGFKSGIEKLSEMDLPIRKKHITSIWGVDGFKGMILFNLITTYASKTELNTLGKVLRNCFFVPSSIDEAVIKIDLFSEHLEKIQESITPEKIKNSKYPNKSWIHIKSNINPSYSPAFIPVFWDMQKLDKFPIFYTSCEKIIHVLDEKDRYFKKDNSPGENYKLFYDFNIELISRLQDAYKRPFNFSDISTNYLNYIYRFIS